MRLHPNHPIHTQTQDFWSRSEANEYCQKILSALKVQDQTEFTMSDILKMLDISEVQNKVLVAMSILSGSHCSIFDVLGFMLKSDGSRIILSAEQMDKAIQDQAFPHPETGEIVENPAAHTFLLYRLREDATRPPKIGEITTRSDKGYGTYHYQCVAHIDLLKCGADNPLPSNLHPRTAFRCSHILMEWGKTEIFISIPLRSINQSWREINPDCDYRKSNPKTQYLPISIPDKEFQEWAQQAAPWIIDYQGK